MDTSGSGPLSIALYVITLAASVNVAIRMPLTRRVPVAAIVLTVVIGAVSLLQYVFPVLTAALLRDPDLELHHGQWWRLLTAVLVQDGGIASALFDLVVVAVVTTLGEWVWGRWRMLALFLLPSLVLNVLAVFWNAPGGGSSFADLGLFASICALALLTGRWVWLRVIALVPIVDAIILIIAGDAHGVAIVVGFVLGLLATVTQRSARRPRANVSHARGN